MKTNPILYGIIILSFLIAGIGYWILPNTIATHWNAEGKADGYMEKFWGLILFPLINLFLLALFLAIPKIDPLKKNIQEFQKYYEEFIIIVELFFTYILVLSIGWNAGYLTEFTFFLIPGISILLYYTGKLITKAKRNYFIGIRTPWTLASEKVWNETHQKTGILFKIASIITLGGMIFPEKMLEWIIIPIAGVALYGIAYSFIAYQKEEKRKGKKQKKK